MVSKDKKYKSWIFLASYALYMLQYAIDLFFAEGKGVADIDSNSAGGEIMWMMRQVSLSQFFGICFVLFLSINKRKTSWSRPVKLLMAGLVIWITWGVFITFGGVGLFSNVTGRKYLLKLTAFTAALFMAAKITETYDLRKELVGIAAFILGTTLLFAYITHFNGLEFVESIANVLNKIDRYRVSFGLRHYNTTGSTCLAFFMFTALYKLLFVQRQYSSSYAHSPLHTHKKLKYKNDALYTYLLLLVPIVIIMLISCASRTCISSITGFWLMYAVLGKWPRIGSTTKAMILTALIFMIFILAAALDWGKIWSSFSDYSLRGSNYSTSLPILTQKRAWLVGFGFGFLENFNRLRDATALDSFYLYTLLQSGLVGLFILVSTIACFSFMYFRNIKHITKLQRMTGSLLTVMLWYALFETVLYSIDPINMLEWILLILAADEMYPILNEEGTADSKILSVRLSEGSITS